jgi:hypothetical protein
MVEHRHRNPAIVAGSLLSPFAGAKPLLVVTGLLVLVFGVSFLFFPKARSLTREAGTTRRGCDRLTVGLGLSRSRSAWD